MLSRFGEAGLRDLDALMIGISVDVVPFAAPHVHLAVDAFRHFGKGRHLAGLNFGDCFSYAWAKATGEPLLFKGDDFSRTDIRRTVRTRPEIWARGQSSGVARTRASRAVHRNGGSSLRPGNAFRCWRTRHDSNVRPSPSEGDALSS